MIFKITEEQARDLAEVLGAAQGVFDYQAGEATGTKRLYFELMAGRADRHARSLADQFNAQFKNVDNKGDH